MHEHYDAGVLAECLDNEAKWYWGASLVMGLGVFICGVVGTFATSAAMLAAIIATVITLIGYYWDQRGEATKGKASELRRKLDMQDSFGWVIERTDLNNLLVHCSRSVKQKARGRQPTETYFFSKEPVGPERSLQNIRESAWWSRHLSIKMFRLMLIITAGLFIVSLFAFLALLSTVNSHFFGSTQLYTKFTSSVMSFLMLAVSLNLVKLTLGYYKFARGASNTESLANALLKTTSITADKTLICMYEYFIVRNESPVLPTWLWKYNKNELNDLYPYK